MLSVSLFCNHCFCSVERLQALQLELTAVSLLRQQLENGVQMNEKLRDELQREIQRVKQTEGGVKKEGADNQSDLML